MPRKSRKMKRSVNNNNNNNNNNSKRSMGRTQNKRKSKRGKSRLGTPDLNNLDNNKFYCFKCGVVQCNGVKMDSKKMKNGCQRLVAQCSKCTTKLYRILPKA